MGEPPQSSLSRLTSPPIRKRTGGVLKKNDSHAMVGLFFKNFIGK